MNKTWLNVLGQLGSQRTEIKLILELCKRNVEVKCSITTDRQNLFYGIPSFSGTVNGSSYMHRTHRHELRCDRYQHATRFLVHIHSGRSNELKHLTNERTFEDIIGSIVGLSSEGNSKISCSFRSIGINVYKKAFVWLSNQICKTMRSTCWNTEKSKSATLGRCSFFRITRWYTRDRNTNAIWKAHTGSLSDHTQKSKNRILWLVDDSPTSWGSNALSLRVAWHSANSSSKWWSWVGSSGIIAESGPISPAD